MGVTGLWTVVQPCARPIKIETLNRKRLAVDASIWIYQFLKAVRDKEGNALRNSHVVGFFRRICKLLFIGIQPVFVFDGGAPALKRQTISNRKSRREGRKEDAVRTAGKLLALQMQRRAEEEEQKRKDAERGRDDREEVVPDDLVYVDELQMTQQERQQNRKFRKKDQYHLPEMDASMAEMGAPNDPRIMSIEELESYARQFDTGEDINVYDFSKIDFDSPFFTSLPASDRYNILNAARLRSRLRMGYSKEQLETMFPDRMAFSKFQIDRVRERNELTQRLMNLNGMNDDAIFGLNGPGRVAGERGREYVLVKNDGVEGGWALGVVTARDEGVESKPIDVDELGKQFKEEDEDGDEDDEFEDVPIEGLNRLPKPSAREMASTRPQPDVRRRRGFPASRGKKGTKARAPRRRRKYDVNSLFVADEPEEAEEADEAEEDEDMSEGEQGTDDEELQRAIAMSMQQDPDQMDMDGQQHDLSAEGDQIDDNDYLDVFQQSKAEEARPIPRGSAAAIARTVNQRAAKAAPKVVFQADSDSENDMDFQDALAESRTEQGRPTTSSLPRQSAPVPAKISKPAPKKPDNAPGFSGPLPFEKLDLGSSLLGKKKMQQMQESSAGGFEKASDKKKDDAQPLPPWFAGNIEEDIAAQKRIEESDRKKAKEFEESQKFEFTQPTVLRHRQTDDVIDVDAPDSPKREKEVIEVDDDMEVLSVEETKDTADDIIGPTTLGRVADAIKAAPFTVESPSASPTPPIHTDQPPAKATPMEAAVSATTQHDVEADEGGKTKQPENDNEEQIDWSESDHEDSAAQDSPAATQAPIEAADPVVPSRSPSPDFEDVDIPDQALPSTAEEKARKEEIQEQAENIDHITGTADQNAPMNDDAEDYGLMSDSEDEDLMRQLAIEAEEHARFASELNHKSQQENIQEYERELKQLRSQQKKDRRDADEVTHIMVTECQQLLKLFGLPYITAPMEAEAQCAELVRLNLVDGIVTDDSDCFLFGGTRIYKNMFNQARFVECYLASDFEKEFDLSRQKLIGIAQLLGSDYTEGLPGVGPVSALEILSEFPTLNDFKDWWGKVQMNEIPKSAEVGNPFRRKFRKNANKLFLPASFPDPRVDMAYLQPEVDSDPSHFQWGVPDLSSLRSFLMATIGWSQERTDEVLVPVIKDMNQRMNEGTQSNITKFFAGGTGAGAYAPRVRMEQGSQRMGKALDRMAQRAQRKRKGGPAVEEVPADVEAQEEAEAQEPKTKKRAPRKRKAQAQADTEGADAEDEDTVTARPKRAARKKRAVVQEEEQEDE